MLTINSVGSTAYETGGMGWVFEEWLVSSW